MSCSLAPPENGGERERVDKAEMGSAPNIVDVSPCFEAFAGQELA